MNDTKRAIAKAIVELEISVDGVWGMDSTLGQADKQAVEGAENQIQLLIKGHPEFRIQGTPKIRISLVES